MSDLLYLVIITFNNTLQDYRGINIKKIILMSIIILLFSSSSAIAIQDNPAYEFTMDNFTIIVNTPSTYDRDGNGVNDTIDITIDLFASDNTPETLIFINSSLYANTLGNWDLLEFENRTFSLVNLPETDPFYSVRGSLYNHIAKFDGEYKYEYDVIVLNTTEHIELPIYYLEHFNASLRSETSSQDIIWQRTIETSTDTTDPIVSFYYQWRFDFLIGLGVVLIIINLIKYRNNII